MKIITTFEQRAPQDIFAAEDRVEKLTLKRARTEKKKLV